MSRTSEIAAALIGLALLSWQITPAAAQQSSQTPAEVQLGTALQPTLAGQRRIAVTIQDNCHTTEIADDNCDFDNADTRTFLATALNQSLTSHGLVVASADVPTDLRLVVTITEVGDNSPGATGFLCLLCDALPQATASASYQVTDAAGRIGPGGSVHTTADGTRAGLQKLADEIATGVTGQSASGVPGTASMGPGVARSYAAGYRAGQQVALVAGNNYRDLVAKAYRLLPTKPPVPADALTDKNAAAAALARGDVASAVTAYTAAVHSAPWWPDAERELAVASARAGQLPAAIVADEMYLKLSPDAPDAGEMKAKLDEWSKAAPPPILPSNIAMPPGLPGWGIQVADTPDVVTSAMGRPNAKGVLVLLVLTGSPAQTAGFEVGDVIVSVNGDAITSPENLRAITSTLPPHTIAQAAILRGGKQITLNVP